jgi:hypothetical protein
MLARAHLLQGFRWFCPIHRFRLTGKVAIPVLALLTAFAALPPAAKADDGTTGQPQTPCPVDPEEILPIIQTTTDPEVLRQLLLMLYWAMGGDPTTLDPAWTPPADNPVAANP